LSQIVQGIFFLKHPPEYLFGSPSLHTAIGARVWKIPFLPPAINSAAVNVKELGNVFKGHDRPWY